MKNTFKINLPNGKVTSAPPPKMQMYRIYRQLENDSELISWFSEATGIPLEIILQLSVDQLSTVVAEYLNWIAVEKKNNQNLNLPYYPTADESKAFFEINYTEAKIIADYANCSIHEVWEFDVFTYWALLHDAVVHNLQQTEKGREYLEDAYNLMQTEPDREMLRKTFRER